jgi:hypothetical protein
MMRNWKLASLSSLLAVALASAPAPAGGTDGVQPPTDKLKALEQGLEEMNKRLKKAFEQLGVDITAIKDDVKTIKDNQADADLKLLDARGKVNALEKQYNQLRLDIEALRKRIDLRLYPPPGDKEMLDRIEDRLTKIEQALKLLQPPTVSKLGPAAANTGRVVLVNAYTEELLFLVNGKAYRVAAGNTAVLDNLPAGQFTYEVISPTYGLRARNSPFLEAGKSFIITAR